MKNKELKEALRMINKVLIDPRIGPDQGDQLQKAKRELVTAARSGRSHSARVYRAIEILAAVLVDVVDATRRSE